MRFTPIALAAAAVHGVVAAPQREVRPAPGEQVFSCGAPEPDAEHIKISQQFAAQEAELLASGNLTTQATINVDLYFHVVATSTDLSGGYIPVRLSFLILLPLGRMERKENLKKQN